MKTTVDPSELQNYNVRKIHDKTSPIDFVNLHDNKSLNFISEHIRVSELCIKGNAIFNESIWTVNMFTALEEIFNNFNAKYLALFFMSGSDRARLTDVGIYSNNDLKENESPNID